MEPVVTELYLTLWKLGLFLSARTWWTPSTVNWQISSDVKRCFLHFYICFQNCWGKWSMFSPESWWCVYLVFFRGAAAGGSFAVFTQLGSLDPSLYNPKTQALYFPNVFFVIINCCFTHRSMFSILSSVTRLLNYGKQKIIRVLI